MFASNQLLTKGKELSPIIFTSSLFALTDVIVKLSTFIFKLFSLYSPGQILIVSPLFAFFNAFEILFVMCKSLPFVCNNLQALN